MTIRQLRIYTVPERKREAFFDRWDATARPLMEEHDFRVVDSWTGDVDPTSATVPVRLAKALLLVRRPRSGAPSRKLFEFGYELEWDDLDQLRAGWAAFLDDQRWVEAKSRSRGTRLGEPVLWVSDRLVTPRPRS